ncbi:hypothetical protein JW968_03320 [Candidatus Woesearchaeota archaeon]|nr:hypothetical protein [Candidatus Woesearchaeota archaeon]
MPSLQKYKQTYKHGPYRVTFLNAPISFAENAGQLETMLRPYCSDCCPTEERYPLASDILDGPWLIVDHVVKGRNKPPTPVGLMLLDPMGSEIKKIHLRGGYGKKPAPEKAKIIEAMLGAIATCLNGHECAGAYVGSVYWPTENLDEDTIQAALAAFKGTEEPPVNPAERTDGLLCFDFNSGTGTIPVQSIDVKLDQS